MAATSTFTSFDRPKPTKIRPKKFKSKCIRERERETCTATAFTPPDPASPGVTHILLQWLSRSRAVTWSSHAGYQCFEAEWRVHRGVAYRLLISARVSACQQLWPWQWCLSGHAAKMLDACNCAAHIMIIASCQQQRTRELAATHAETNMLVMMCCSMMRCMRRPQSALVYDTRARMRARQPLHR